MTFQKGHTGFRTKESYIEMGKKLKGGNSGSFKKGEHKSPKTEFKKGDATTNKNINWKGDGASYHAKHIWLKYNFGKADKCENPDCKGRCKVYHWCLKTGYKYEHKRENYIMLCVSCHRLYDYGKLKLTK